MFFAVGLFVFYNFVLVFKYIYIYIILIEFFLLFFTLFLKVKFKTLKMEEILIVNFRVYKFWILEFENP